MDAEELSGFFTEDILYLSFVTGLLIVAHSKLILLLTEYFRRRRRPCGALQLAQRQLRSITESGVAVPFVWNVRTRRLVPNPALIRFLGLEDFGPAAFTMGLREGARFIHPDDRVALFAALRQVRSKAGKNHELRWMRPDGRVLRLGLRLELDLDAQGGPQRVVGLCLNLTAAKAAAEALRVLEDRFGALLQRPELNGAVHTPAALAHELSQPLGAILGWALAAQLDLAANPDAPPDFTAKIAHIVETCKDASAVIQRVQARTRGEAVRLQTLDLNEIAERALRKLDGASCLRGITVEMDLADDLPKVRGDAVELTQILHNLIRNAGEAMAAPSNSLRTLTIRTHENLLGEVCLAVSDRGPGLSADLQESVFQPFHTSKPDGLGLGLPICRYLATIHDGTISGANNAEGPGAVFTLTLPATNPVFDYEPDPDEGALHHLCCR